VGAAAIKSEVSTQVLLIFYRKEKNDFFFTQF